MCKQYKNGNPKRKSRFICLECLNENYVGQGIQRRNQREKFHVKDLLCLCCNKTTKNIEIRFCDDYNEVKDKAIELHNCLY